MNKFYIFSTSNIHVEDSNAGLELEHRPKYFPSFCVMLFAYFIIKLVTFYSSVLCFVYILKLINTVLRLNFLAVIQIRSIIIY